MSEKTLDQLQKELDDARQARENLKNSLASATPSTRSSIQKQYEAAKKTFDNAEKAFNKASDAAKKVQKEQETAQAATSLASERDRSKAQSDISALETAVSNASAQFNSDPNDNKKFATYQQSMEKLNSRYLFYQAKGIDFPRKVQPAQGGGYIEVAPQEVAAETRTVAGRRATAGMRGESGVIPARTTATPTTPSQPVPPSAPSVTPAKGKGKGKKAPVVSPDAWKDILRERFPAYNNDWLTENATTHFGQDVIELMIEAANPNGKFGGLKTEDGLKAYELAFRQTNYYLNTTSAAKQFDQSTPATQKALVDAKKLELSGELGDVGLDETTLNALASDAARKGLTGLGLRQAAYSYILKPADQPTAIATRAMEAADADRIREIGRAYNYNVSDSELKSILTGAPTAAGVVLTEEGLRQKAQNWAKGAMPQLADQIDRGLTLEEIGGNYQKYAAQILEQPEDKIDMFSGPYLQAFGTKETGQMSLGDWIERLKSDSRFGWQYTKQANQQATDVALSIARAFGKVQ
jgi:hypothetical protein